MAIYAKVGTTSQQYGGTCPDGWVEMNEGRPSSTAIAQEDGTWVLVESDIEEDPE